MLLCIFIIITVTIRLPQIITIIFRQLHRCVFPATRWRAPLHYHHYHHYHHHHYHYHHHRHLHHYPFPSSLYSPHRHFPLHSCHRLSLAPSPFEVLIPFILHRPFLCLPSQHTSFRIPQTFGARYTLGCLHRPFSGCGPHDHLHLS